jgi:hypothetical protein
MELGKVTRVSLPLIQEGQMDSANLGFLCPITKRGIDSGFDSDNVSRIRMENSSVRIKCPHCGHAHEFLISDSYGRLNERPEEDKSSAQP